MPETVSDRLARLPEPPADRLEPLPPLACDLPPETPWSQAADAVKARWLAFLGQPGFDSFPDSVELVREVALPWARGRLVRQSTGPDQRQLVLLLEPPDAGDETRPGVVVPYYHPDLMAGWDLATDTPMPERPSVQFGRHLVERGCLVACCEAFPFNTVPEPEDTSHSFNWWRAAAARLLADHPAWSGMGKLLHDTRRSLDLLLADRRVDPARVLTIGHSLGGKMAFYTGCLDPRVTATIASDFGIGWRYTNWSDPWYHGERCLAADLRLAHHQLAALHAPRPLLVIAGEYDHAGTAAWLRPAAELAAAAGRPDAIGLLDHGSGHTPPPEAMLTAYEWLAEQWDLPPWPPLP